jgi:GTP-binding protein HflX
VRAELLLHVVDAASPARKEQQAEVNKVLAEIGAAETPQIVVFNKVDAAGLETGVERDQYGRISRVFVSARTGSGLQLLREAVAEFGVARNAERNPPKASISL